MSQEKIGKRLKQALQITGYPKRQETYENVLELLIRETQIKTTMNSPTRTDQTQLSYIAHGRRTGTIILENCWVASTRAEHMQTQ